VSAALQHVAVRDDDAVDVPGEDALEARARSGAVAEQAAMPARFGTAPCRVARAGSGRVRRETPGGLAGERGDRMKREVVGRLGSLWVAGAVTSAVVAAIAITASTGANAVEVKAKPVVVGRLALGGVTSDVTAYSWEVTAASSWTSGSGASVG
jgi:hypothetical protein